MAGRRPFECLTTHLTDVRSFVSSLPLVGMCAAAKVLRRCHAPAGNIDGDPTDGAWHFLTRATSHAGAEPRTILAHAPADKGLPTVGTRDRLTGCNTFAGKATVLAEPLCLANPEGPAADLAYDISCVAGSTQAGTTAEAWPVPTGSLERISAIFTGVNHDTIIARLC
ncbi:MAG: hypothetical protein IVW55_03510 [Chloroflexi bacterium]|nr:hypothetical protein [Chloroflexota bacterium]